MSNKEILEKAIQKATDNYLGNAVTRQLFWLLTKDEFMVAKALWGESMYIEPASAKTDYNTVEHVWFPMYHHHLQQMVIAKDPIKYLWENI